MTLKDRINMERRIVRETVKLFLDEGFLISVNDGETTTVKKSRDKKEIMKAVMTTDEDYMYFYKPLEDMRFGWIYFVYGNDGYDVIADHTAGAFEEVLAPITELCSKLESESCAHA